MRILKMSAKTRPQVIDSVRLQVADLRGSCAQLIRENKRTPAMVNGLRGALQMFKENRLAGAIALQPVLSIDQLQDQAVVPLLSIEVASLLSKAGQNWCRSRGIKYVGELVRVTLDHRAMISQELEESIRSFG